MLPTLPQKMKVFEALCAAYEKRLYYVPVRIVARRADVPVSTASTELKALEDAGIVVRRGVRGGWRPRPMYERTYRYLLDVFRRTHGTVRIQTVADLSDKSYWTVRLHLHKLKDAGLVVQVGGGWKPLRRNDINPVSGLVIEVLSELFHEDYSHVRTVEIAQRLDVTPRYVRHVLRDYEEVGQVERKGRRGGWRPAYAGVTHG